MSKQSIAILASALALVIGFLAGARWSEDSDTQTVSAVETALRLTAGPFRVAVTVDPDVPIIGDNDVMLVITDAEGRPVEGAEVSITATMRAMGAMPEMRALANMSETSAGRYQGTISLPMDGSWPLSVTIEKAGVGRADLVFDMATRRSGLDLVSGAQAPSNQTQQAEATIPPGTISVDARRRQAIGLTIGEAAIQVMRRQVRAVGRVTYDETRLSDVSLRFDAWIGELFADHVGAVVNRGDTLFSVYGPDLLTAQQEYLEILRRNGSASLKEAARKRLELWNLPEREIAALAARGTPLDYVPITAPRSGVVIAKDVVEGTAHRAGVTLMRIADLSEVWIDAQIYEADLATIAQGMRATVTLPFLPGQTFEGQIDYIYPFLESASRTARIRVPLDNSDGALKPDMYAEVLVEIDLGQRLVVPTESVIFAGESRVVFEDLGDGRLAPRRIQTGQRNGDYIEVLDGIAAGARIVTSGTFLIASESRLSSGLDQW